MPKFSKSMLKMTPEPKNATSCFFLNHSAKKFKVSQHCKGKFVSHHSTSPQLTTLDEVNFL